MDVATRPIHRGRWRLLCHILWLLCRLFRGPDYDTTTAVLYHLTLEDLDTIKSCLYRRIIGGTQPSDDLVERLIRIAGRIAKISPHNGLLQQVIRQMLDHRINSPEGETTKNPRSLPGDYFLSLYPRQPLPSPPTTFPPAGQVFDLLMGRDTMQREHPSQLSSVLVHWASVIELDALETEPPETHEAAARPSLDLSPLYGRDDTARSSMRKFREGLLKTDCFASQQAARLPPGVGVLLVLLNRYHNYVATRLQAINESGRFTVPETSRPSMSRAAAAADDDDAWARHDEALFQSARRVTCGLYGNIIAHDYLKTLLGLNESGSDFTVDPRVQGPAGEVPASPPEPMQPCVLGFWKAMVSERDNQWMEGHLREAAGEGQAMTAASARAGSAYEKGSHRPPEGWLLGEHGRIEDGALSEEALAAELTASVRAVASAYDSRRTPWAFRATEARALERGRPATLNAYHAGLGLARHTTWEALHAPARVARTLRAVYADPATIDLQAGLLAEQQAPRANASTGGLAGGPTINRALLRDTVALLRVSPRLADALDPAIVTRWGSREVVSDPQVAHGGVMHKLILRALPRSFAPSSIYAHFPLVVPARGRAILARLADDGSYDLATPTPPPLTPFGAALPRPTRPGTYEFRRQHAQLINRLPGNTYHDTQHLVEGLVQGLAPPRGAGAADLVRDVACPVLVRLYCRLFHMDMAEKTKSQGGSVAEVDVWDALSSIYDAEAHHEPASALGREKRAHGAVEVIRNRILEAQRGRRERTWMERAWGRWADSSDVDHSMCPLIRAMAVQVGAMCHVLVESVEYFTTNDTASWLRFPGGPSRDGTGVSDCKFGCRGLARPQKFDVALGYMLEGFRLAAMQNGQSYWRGRHGPAPALVDISTTASDPSVFPHARRFQADRPLAAYEALGIGDLTTACPVVQATLGIFTVILGLPGLRPEAAPLAPRRVTLPFPPGMDGSGTETRRDEGLGGEAFHLVEEVRADVDPDSDWMVVWNDHDGVDGKRGATMYLSADQGELCAVPRSLPLTWDVGCS